MKISTAHCFMIDAVCEDLSNDQRPESGSVCLHKKATSGMYRYLLSKSEKYYTANMFFIYYTRDIIT